MSGGAVQGLALWLYPTRDIVGHKLAEPIRPAVNPSDSFAVELNILPATFAGGSHPVTQFLFHGDFPFQMIRAIKPGV